jgi:hypothetical protein
MTMSVLLSAKTVLALSLPRRMLNDGRTLVKFAPQLADMDRALSVGSWPKNELAVHPAARGDLDL